MASKLTTLQNKLELLTEEFEKKKEDLVESINEEKSRLKLLAANAPRIGERVGETYGSYFVKFGEFYYGISTKLGAPSDVEEVSKELVDTRLETQ